MTRREIWDLWEKIAAKFLIDKWWVFVENNFYQKNFWEIDLIFKDWNQVVFVEVKTRTSWHFWEWFEAVERKKLQKMAKTWEIFCKKNNIDFDETRFDVISILISLNWDKIWKMCKIKHLKKVL